MVSPDIRPYSPTLLPEIAEAVGAKLPLSGVLIVNLGEKHSVMIADDADAGKPVLRFSRRDEENIPQTITERHIDGASVAVNPGYGVAFFKEGRQLSTITPDSVTVFDPDGVRTEFVYRPRA